MQSLLTTLSNNASMFGMRFSPSKCKMLLQDWVASTPELMKGNEVIERVDRFTYLGSLISPCGLVCDEISARIQKARLAFANLRHLWRRRDIRLPTKGRVYCAAVRSVLLYGTPTSDKVNPISLTKDQEKASCSTLSDDILFVESHLVNRGSAKHKKPKNSKRKHKTKHKKQHKSKKVSRKAPISSSDSNSSDTSD
ncbi:unnamed protein product [Schistosoma margrebowiei]|uniref:Uncharacterized protein n=1 Tax=Schistosoma margrebowiei TaxID=48269 RepID=A0A183LG93_9TREM|nr:unnamed protein product [Schistosoma margrebowiei]